MKFKKLKPNWKIQILNELSIVMGLFAGTEFDRPLRCEKCEELEAECVCPPELKAETSPSSQKLKVYTEKRKRGKMVTVVSGHVDEPEVVQSLLTKLKTICGAGGTLKEGNIEIQGDHVDRVKKSLAEMGYKVT